MDALLVGDDAYSFHEFERLGPLLVSCLESADVTVTATTDWDDVLDVSAHDVLVDYSTDNDRTETQRDALLEFVRGGGGYAGVHPAADLTAGVDEPDPEMEALLGGMFLDHPDQTDLPVHVVADHPITEGVEEFEVYDEPYRLRYGDVDVLARMEHPELGDMPVAWVKPYGDGRVFYCSLGHDESALEHDSVRRLVSRGALWAGGAL
jgi:type 1 glutamine amidotransferase